MTRDDENRRRHKRYPFFLLAEEQGDPLLSQWTENIATDSLFFQTPESYEPGAALSVRLSFPGFLKPFEVSGTVAWARPASTWLPAGVGLEVQRGQPKLEALTRACEALSPSSDAPLRVLGIQATLPSKQKNSHLKVTAVDTPEQALARVEEAKPHVLVTKVFSPLASCLQMIKEIRDQTTVPILALPSDDKDASARAVQAGANGMLAHGTPLSQVLNTVQVLLRVP